MQPTAAVDATTPPLHVALRAWVRALASDIGERNLRDDPRHANLERAADLIETSFRQFGLSCVRTSYLVAGRRTQNLECLLGGSSDLPALVVGAHYDSARRAPGANDNGTGVACLLGLACLLGEARLRRPVRLVAFTNEEHPYTRTAAMGSHVYARDCAAAGREVAAMLSLETLCTTRHRRPHARAQLFVVGNLASRSLAREVSSALDVSENVASRAISAPGFLPGVRSSDHWSFWQLGIPAGMITAGGPLTYRHYHRRSDRVENVDLAHLTATCRALGHAVAQLCQ
jgi:Zn-dependent M28 family amino/carboxypeptidase